MKIKVVYLSFLLVAVITVSSWLAIVIVRNLLARNQQQVDSCDFFMNDMKYKQMGTSGLAHDQLQAAKMVHYPLSDGVYIFNNLRLIMADKDGSPWYITANRGSSRKHGGVIFVWDNVVVEKHDKSTQMVSMKVVTSAATVYPKQKIAETDKPLTITQGGSVFDAVGAKINFDASTIKFKSRVKGKYAADRSNN